MRSVTTRTARFTTMVLLGAGGLSACGLANEGTVSAGRTGTADAQVVVDVTTSPSTCQVSTGSFALQRGAVAFVVRNTGRADASFSFLADGNDSIGEVPSLAPGSTRTLLVEDVVPGPYTVACSTDRGTVRHDLQVTGVAG